MFKGKNINKHSLTQLQSEYHSGKLASIPFQITLCNRNEQPRRFRALRGGKSLRRDDGSSRSA